MLPDFIRYHFGLWDGNTALIESCGDAEGASNSIIEMTWNALRETNE